MAQSSATLHEDSERLPDDLIDRHRAVVSLMEELEAVDWYDQRVHACSDPELRAILAHNRDEEKEHAAMVLEWLRRNDPTLDLQLKMRLRRPGSIVAAEAEQGAEVAPAATAAASTDGGSLGIGSLRVLDGEEQGS